METVKNIIVLLIMVASCIIWYEVGEKHALNSVQQTPEPFHICAMCETHIDTVGDKALRQWMDTDIRIKFKKWLILEEKKK